MFFKALKIFVYACCLFLLFAMLLALKNSTLSIEQGFAFVVTIAFLLSLVHIKFDNDKEAKSISANKKFMVNKKTYQFFWQLLFIAVIGILGLGFFFSEAHVLLPLFGLTMLVLKFFVVVEKA